MTTFYTSRDMAKVGCGGCRDCSKCCCNMGQSIVLNPYDVHLLSENMGLSFEELLSGPLELSSEAGIVHPNLRMLPIGNRLQCGFLDESGRCSVHSFRPGICRLFPLGRDYSDGRIAYFLLEDACPSSIRTKEKISSWLGFSSEHRLKQYEDFLLAWHLFIRKKREEIYADAATAREKATQISTMLLDVFYIPPYEDFFAEINERMQKHS